MIEINLLPGSGKKKSSRSGGSAAKKINFGAFFANITQKIRDPWPNVDAVSANVMG